MWAAQVGGGGSDEASSPESERMSDFEARASSSAAAAPRLLEPRRAPCAGYSAEAGALLAAHYALDGSPPWPFCEASDGAWRPAAQQELPWVEQRELLPCAEGTPVRIDWETLAQALEKLVKTAQASRRTDDLVLRPSFDRLCERLAHIAASPAPRSTQYKRSLSRTAAKAVDKCVRIWAPFLRRAEARPSTSASPSASASSSQASSPSTSLSKSTSPDPAEPDTRRSLLDSSVERMWLQRSGGSGRRSEGPRADVIDIDAHLSGEEALTRLLSLLQMYPARAWRVRDELGEYTVSSSTSLPRDRGENGRHLYVLGSAEQRNVVINHVAQHTRDLASSATLILTQRGASTQSGSWAEAGVLPSPLPPSVACFQSVINMRFMGSAASPFRGIARAIAAGSSSWIDLDTFAGSGTLVTLGSARPATKHNGAAAAAAAAVLPLPTLASMAAAVAKQAGASAAELADALPESLLRHFDFPPYACVSCRRLIHAPPTRAPLWSRLEQELPDDHSVSFYWACRKLADLDVVIAEARTYGYLPAWIDYLFNESSTTGGSNTQQATRSIAVGGRGLWIEGLPPCEWRFCYECAVRHTTRGAAADGKRCCCLMCSPASPQQGWPSFVFSRKWKRHVLDRAKVQF